MMSTEMRYEIATLPLAMPFALLCAACMQHAHAMHACMRTHHASCIVFVHIYMHEIEKKSIREKKVHDTSQDHKTSKSRREL